MYSKKLAFTMIELIFAIVVIGISVISIPVISQVSQSGLEKNLAQEAILLTSADIIRAMSGKWDENSKPDNIDFEYIVFTSDAEVTNADNNNQRPGNIRILYHPDNTLRVTSTIDGLDDIDDYDTSSSKVNAVDDVASAEMFKDQYKKDISVNSTQSFGTLTNNANIKKILIETYSQNDEKLVQLYMYVMNTGSSSALTRTLP